VRRFSIPARSYRSRNKLFQTAIFQLYKSPSEEPALAMALALADKTNADIVVGLIQIATV
jgi:hypothetical protein